MPSAFPLEPPDEWNRKLQANVHPADWQNPRPPAGRYNLLVLGAGTAGLVSAAAAAGLGARVAIVERSRMGGDCLNYGCVPSKALLRTARAVADVRHATRLGIELPEEVPVQFSAVMQRMRRLRAGISHHDSAQRFRELGVDVYFGTAKFTGPAEAEVDGIPLRFAKAVIATGARASLPPIAGIEQAGCLTNETVFQLTELPPRLVVLGAGPIGCELAQAFARFGSKVYLFEAEHGILPREDADAAEIVKQSLLQDGVELLCCGKQLQLSRAGDTRRVQVESHGRAIDVTADAILCAVGRRPNVEDLQLEAAQVACNATGVVVNDRLQTTNPRIYAAGDVCSRFQFTHAADAMARIVVQNALFLGRAGVSSLTIPWCTYTDPELAHVGLSEKSAQQQGIPIRTFAQPFSSVDRAVLDDEPSGMLKIHVAERRDQIVGATIVARHAGDLLPEITLAMTRGLGLKALSRVIHAYPTQAEAIKKAADAFQRTRLTPLVQWLAGHRLAWSR